MLDYTKIQKENIMKEEREQISPNDAEKIHNIFVNHSQMPNGELRFRLTKKSDNTAYIRTEAPPNGGWQNAHSHSQILETYIVQKGWIGYAEKSEKGTLYRLYYENEIFTTKVHTIHNIYLPKDSVIHTVKHGDAKNEVRKENKEFTSLTHNISEQAFLKLADKQISIN